MNIDTIGDILEHQGFSDEAIDDYFAHFGVRGMSWGVRKQNRLDLKSAKLTQKAGVLVNRANKLDVKSAKITSRRDGGGMSKTKVVAIGAGVVALAAGAFFAKKYLGGKGKEIPIKKIGTYLGVTSTGVSLAKSVLAGKGSQPVSQIYNQDAANA